MTRFIACALTKAMRASCAEDGRSRKRSSLNAMYSVVVTPCRASASSSCARMRRSSRNTR